MSSFVKVASRAELPPGGKKLVEVDGRAIAVFHCDGVFYAIDDICTHDGGPLAEGELFGGEKPWLWAVYVMRNNAWQVRIYPGHTRSIELTKDESGAAATAVAVSQIDRCGNESARKVQSVATTPGSR